MVGSFSVIWKGARVGVVTDLTNDMWYFDGKWSPHESALSEDFERTMSELDITFVARNLLAAPRFVLINSQTEEVSFYCLGMLLENGILSFRMITEGIEQIFPEWPRPRK